jgi:hypothetical protein
MDKNFPWRQLPSHPTLEKIASQNLADDDFRQKFIDGDIVAGEILGSAGLAAFSGTAYALIQGASYWWLVGTALGGIFSYSAIIETIKARKRRKQFLKEKQDPFRHISKGHYLLGDRISLESTLVENHYGHPLQPIELRRKEMYRQPADKYYFADHLRISGVKEDREVTEEECWDSDGLVTRKEKVSTTISFDLKRNEITARMEFYFGGHGSSPYAKMLSLEGEFAMIFRAKTIPNRRFEFLELVRLYHPHP